MPSLGHDGKTQAALDADTLFLAESTETMGKFGIVLCMIAGVSGLLFGFDSAFFLSSFCLKVFRSPVVPLLPQLESSLRQSSSTVLPIIT